MKTRLFWYFVNYLKPYWGKECLLLLMMILTSVSSLVSPYVLKIIIDSVFPSRNYMLLLQILCVLVAINVFRIIINFVSDYLFAWISNHVTRDIRISVFRHLLKLPMSFYDKNKTGDLIHRMNSEVNSIQNFLTGTIVRLIESLFTILGLVVMLCILNYKLFFFSMLVMPFIFFNTRWFQPKIQKTIKKGRERDSDILSFLLERLENIKLIKGYVRYGEEEAKLSGKIQNQITLDIKATKLTSTTRGITVFFTTLVPVFIFGIGGKDVMAGSMTIGALVAFIQYMNRIFDPFRNLMGLYFDSLRVVVSMERIFELLNHPVEGNNITLFHQPAYGPNDIIFRNVEFRYGDTLVIKNLNFRFQKGKKYALVGGSGCGKSTLIDLLCRYYDMENGDILIGESNIQNLDINGLRQKITLVTQENQLFHDTISENICYGKCDCSCDEMDKVVRSVALDQLTQKLDTIIGDKGVQLSGGQRQRIAIARAVLREADIIVLDEATSALDSDSEKSLLTYLCTLFQDKTVIVISHRLSTVRDMDEIVCMDNGTIVESGTHNELMNKKGYFWRLFKEQIE